MSEQERELATAPISKLLFKLAVPCVAAQVINALYNIVDRIYIGHLPGEGRLALGALGICYPIIMMISAFAALVGNGGAPRASIALGRGHEQKAQEILNNCVTAMVCLSVVLFGLFSIFAEPLLRLFGATESMLPYALDYLRIYLLGTVSVQITLSMNAFITAQGFTNVSMFTTLIGAVLNIVLDPIFIFTLHMGVQGAALASVISQTVSAVWVLCFLVGKTTKLKIQKQFLRPKMSVLLPVFALGVSPFVMQITESAVQSCFNIQMRAYGGADAETLISAVSIMLSILQFSSLPCSGLGQGAQPITSFNYGAGQYSRVRENFFLFLRVNAIYLISFVTLGVLFPGLFARIFTTDAEVIALVSHYLPRFLFGMYFFCLLNTCQNTFVALGQATRSMCIAMLRKIVLLIPLMFLLPHWLGIDGIILAEPVADVVASCTAAVVFYFFSKTIFRKEDEKLPGNFG